MVGNEVEDDRQLQQQEDEESTFAFMDDFKRHCTLTTKQVLMRVEQEQKITEDARRSAERDAAAQRYLVSVLEEKYEHAMSSVIQWEKRALMAESMVEATLQYDSGQVKAQEKAPLLSLYVGFLND